MILFYNIICIEFHHASLLLAVTTYSHVYTIANVYMSINTRIGYITFLRHCMFSKCCLPHNQPTLVLLPPYLLQVRVGSLDTTLQHILQSWNELQLSSSISMQITQQYLSLNLCIYCMRWFMKLQDESDTFT